jgi:hypothetical protein
MIVMGNDSPYKVQEIIKNWETTHVRSYNEEGKEVSSPAFEGIQQIARRNLDGGFNQSHRETNRQSP